MKAAKLGRSALLLLILIGISWVIMHRTDYSGDALQRWVQGFGSAGPIVFTAIYAVATVLFLPGAVLTLAGGALFGPGWGTLCNLSGATIGAGAAFLIARYIASDWVAQRVGGRLQQILEGTEREGWKFVAFVRLAPLFPFNLLNYALGLTRIKFSHYLIASYVFMVPGALAYTYLGYVGREAAAGRAELVRNGLIAIGLLAFAGFLPTLFKLFKATKQASPNQFAVEPAELYRQLGARADLMVLDVRNADEYGGPIGHIAEAVNIAVGELPDRLSELENFRERSIVVVCLSDKRSAVAIQCLRDHGFQHLALLRGGMNQWTAAGLPVKY